MHIYAVSVCQGFDREFAGVSLSFHLVGSESQTQVIGLNSKPLYPLSQLTGPTGFYLFVCFCPEKTLLMVHSSCTLPQRECLVTSVPHQNISVQSPMPWNEMPNILAEILALTFVLSSVITRRRKGPYW